MEVTALLKLIASLAETAAIKYSTGKYWEGELQNDVSRISQAVRDLERATERR